MILIPILLWDFSKLFESFLPQDELKNNIVAFQRLLGAGLEDDLQSKEINNQDWNDLIPPNHQQIALTAQKKAELLAQLRQPSNKNLQTSESTTKPKPSTSTPVSWLSKQQRKDSTQEPPDPTSQGLLPIQPLPTPKPISIPARGGTIPPPLVVDPSTQPNATLLGSGVVVQSVSFPLKTILGSSKSIKTNSQKQPKQQQQSKTQKKNQKEEQKKRKEEEEDEGKKKNKKKSRTSERGKSKNDQDEVGGTKKRKRSKKDSPLEAKKKILKSKKTNKSGEGEGEGGGSQIVALQLHQGRNKKLVKKRKNKQNP